MGCNKHVTGQHNWQLQISTFAPAYCRSGRDRAVIGLKHRFKNETQLHLQTHTAASNKRCII